MKKVFLLAEFGVAGMMSANTTLGTRILDCVKLSNFSIPTPQDLDMSTQCMVYESSCGEPGFFCREEIEYEEFVEFGYLVEEAFCGGCNIDC